MGEAPGGGGASPPWPPSQEQGSTGPGGEAQTQGPPSQGREVGPRRGGTGRAAKTPRQGKGASQPAPAKEEAPPPPAPAPEEQTQPKDASRGEKEEIVYLDLDQLHPFQNHPFGVRDDNEMKGLVSLPQANISDKQFQYAALCAIHGRACQQFLEILHLLKNGFADGAYARWRSIYELSIIAEFISKNGEDVAKAYCKAANMDDDHHDWAKAAPFFAKSKHVSFDNIKRKCTAENDVWRGQYKLSNKVVHASPQGTFGRLANGPGIEHLIPVGHSDYGLAMPAVNSAISLSIISTYFFNSIPCGDGLVFIQTIQKWAEVIRKYYSDIEASCFETSDGHK